ncbi:MAG: class I SAM-dependent methyltransferase [Candidatus Eremiobacteraeota bacterium]|nr:class I SAM-dependent methyltransferase [Candidatus Eremiobacteraeota bacterium]
MAGLIHEMIITSGKYNRAIELGCAIGGSTKFISEVANETVGVDLDEERIKIAGDRFRNITFEVKNASSTGFPGGSFDVAFLIMMLHEIPDPLIIKEACRLANKVVVIDYNYPVRGIWGIFFRFLEGNKLEQLESMDMEKIFNLNKFNLKEKKVYGDNFRRWIFVNSAR